MDDEEELVGFLPCGPLLSAAVNRSYEEIMPKGLERERPKGGNR